MTDAPQSAETDAPRLARIRERVGAYRPAPDSPETNQAVDDMRYVLTVIDDQRLTETVLRGQIRRGESVVAAATAVLDTGTTLAEWGVQCGAEQGWAVGSVAGVYRDRTTAEVVLLSRPEDHLVTRQRTTFPDRVTDWIEEEL